MTEKAKFPLHPVSWADLTHIFGDPECFYDSHGVLHVSNNWESENMVLINSPLYVPKRVYCHKVLAPILSNILTEISDKGLQHLIYVWNGCFNPRLIRGSSRFSSHTLGISVDLNAEFNPMGTSWKLNKNPKKMAQELIDIFVANGMCWGNDFKRNDPMHFSLAYW